MASQRFANCRYILQYQPPDGVTEVLLIYQLQDGVTERVGAIAGRWSKIAVVLDLADRGRN